MSSFRFDTQFFAVLGLICLIYFVWMDVGLYYNLNSARGSLLVTQNYEKLNGSTHGKTSQPLTSNYFDPYNPISVKLLALDHINHYIHYPLSWWLDSHWLHIIDIHTFISPDTISYSHVVVSMLGARLLISESLSVRRLGAMTFELRNFLDSYDGYVARSRSHKVGMVQESGSWGYYLDGLCDLAGTVFFMLGLLFLLKRNHIQRSVVLPLMSPCHYLLSFIKTIKNFFIRPTKDYILNNNDLEKEEKLLPSSPTGARKGGKEKPKSGLVFSQTCISIFCLSLLQILSSIFWNRYTQTYHTLLEVPVVSSPVNMELIQISIMQSSSFWMIVWSWKVLNQHALMSILQYSIFFDQHVSVIRWIQYIAFAPILVVVVISEMHLQATRFRLWYIEWYKIL